MMEYAMEKFLDIFFFFISEVCKVIGTHIGLEIITFYEVRYHLKSICFYSSKYPHT